MIGKFQEFNNGGSAVAPTYTEYKITTADSSKDNNTIVSASGYSSGYNSITIDKDQAAAKEAPDDCGVWFWNTGLTAADRFALVYDLIFVNGAALASENVVLFCGLTSATTNMNVYSWGVGIDFDFANPRIVRKIAAGVSYSSQFTAMRGIHNIQDSAGGSTAGVGNLSAQAYTQALDADGVTLTNQYSVSPNLLNAQNSTDALYFYVAAGFTAIAAATTEIQFNLYVQDLITNDLI